MNKWIVTLSTLAVVLIVLTIYASNNREKKSLLLENIEKQKVMDKKQEAWIRIKSVADSMKMHCEAEEYNTEFCFLVDFSIHSGKNRFFIWDFSKDTITDSGLCCHGYGQKSTPSAPVFGNVEGCYCSSLGRYRVGDRSYSQYGINVHYKLHGLDATNSNAFKRWVVLHSHTPVAENEIYPSHLPLGYSQGCPVVSDRMMKRIDELLMASTKAVLLYIYT